MRIAEYIDFTSSLFFLYCIHNLGATHKFKAFDGLHSLLIQFY